MSPTYSRLSRTTSNAPLHRWAPTNRLKRTLIVLLAVVALAVPVWLVSAAATNAWRKPRMTAPPLVSHSNTKRNLNSAPVAGTIYVDDSWVGTTPGTDPDGIGPATNFGADSFATIQEGVNAAASGGTVFVYAGNYTEQLMISKNLTLTGENTATTVLHTPATLSTRFGGTFTLVQLDTSAVVDMSGLTISGPYATLNGCADPTYYGIFVVQGANLNFHDAALTNIQLSPASLHGCQTGIAIRAGSQFLTTTGSLTVNNATITGYQKSAIVVDNAGSNGTITNNTITGLGLENIGANGIQISRGAGATITGNNISANECTSPACGSNPITQDQSTGVLVYSTSGVLQISNNTISSNDVGIYNNGDNTTISGNTLVANRYDGIFQDAGSSTITGNTLTGPMNVGVTAVSASLTVPSPASNSTATLTGNTIVGATTGLQLVDGSNADAFVPQLTAHFNRIVSGATAIDNPNNKTADLKNNWWGCNAGPSITGCGAVNGTGADYSPWFKVAAQAVPNSIIPGATSNVSVDLTHVSDNTVPAGTTPDTPVSYGATNGNMTSPTGTITAGTASSQFTSTNSNSATVTVTVDNENINLPITVTAPSFSIDDVTHAEGNPPGTTAYVFTVTKTGTTLLSSSVQFQTMDGTATVADNDYVSQSGPLNFDPSDTTKQITVQVNSDFKAESDEAFTVHLSSASGATISDADGTGTIQNDDVQPTVVYVDDDFTGSIGSDPDGPGGATAIGYDAFKTIQEGVNAVAPGGTVNVAAGTYIENPSVTKAMTLKGAQFGIDARTRAASESIVRTNGVSQNAVFTISANNVTIDGFTIDGDDPGQTGITLGSGEDTNASYGVRPTGAQNQITVQNNIIKRVAIGFRGDGASQGNLINQNLFDSIGFFDFGYAVSLRVNYYADVTNNKMTRVWTGIHSNNHNGAGGPASYTFSGNEIHSYAAGILYWLHFNGATGATISNNQITAQATAVANNFGLLIVTNQNAISSTITGNTITGHAYGIGLFNVPTTSTITLGATNSIVGSTLAGVFLTDNLNFNPVGTTNFLAGGPGAASTVNVSGLSITGNTGDGVKVEGQTNSQTLSVSGATIAGTSGTKGVELVAGQSHINLTASTVTGFATGVALQNSAGATAHFNRIISGTTAIANPNNQTVNLENNWWGCNAGPGNTGCGAVSGTGADFNPWIVLGVSAAPASILPLETSTVTADMTHNSDTNVPVGVTALPLPNASFTATNGGIAPTPNGFTSGQSQSTFTSSNTSSSSACAAVDNEQQCAAITVTPPSFTINDVTLAEGNAGTTAFTFTITKTGAGAASVDYATANGTAIAPSDYTALATTTLNFLSGDASKQVTVLVNGDTTPEATETFSVHLSNPVNATIGDADGLGTITNDDTCAAASTVYVNASWAGTAIGDDPDGAGLATAFGCDSFATIQEGVNAVAAGGTVNVAAGNYPENVTVTKSLSLLGPNAAVDPNTGTRVAEAVVRPAVTQTSVQSSTSGTIFRLGTGSGHIDVTLKGFTIDGNNPSLTNGRTLNGVEVHTGAGIVNSTGSFDANPGAYDATMIVQNNIIQNLERYGVLADNVPARPAVTGTDVSHNKFDNLPSGNNFGGGRGRAIAFEENVYGSATFNVMTRVNVGWQDDNYNLASPGAGTLVDHNEIHTYHRGIFHNLQYQDATAATITNNQVFVETTGDFPASTTNFGVELSSIQSGVGATVTNNSSTGNVYGILLWNLPTTADITVSGGTLSGNSYGVYATGNDPQFSLGAASHSIVSGVTVNNATVAGIGVDDGGNPAATALEVKGNTSITSNAAGSVGILVKGANASANIHDNAASIHDLPVGLTVDGGSATITGNNLYNNITGLRFLNGGTATAHFNRIISTTTAIDNPANATPSLENNWWGCNAGPGNTGCGNVTGTGAVFNPWIVLGVSASPSSILPFGTSTVTADMTHNSANGVPSGSTFIPPVPVSFGATNGTMLPTSGTITSGQAPSTFTSNNTSNGSACADVDNQHTCTTINLAVTITATAGANGSISPSGAVSVTPGSNQTFLIHRNPGYQIADVLVDGASVGAVNNYTFTNVTTNHTIAASFAAAPSVVTVTHAASPNQYDNDYTRINDAVQAAVSGQTIKLSGTFDWTEANAAASWALGSDGQTGGSFSNDDYGITPPTPLNNVTITANNLGDATIQGPGDLAALNLEGVFAFLGGQNQNWTISNLRFQDFDLSIGMFATGPTDFNNTHVVNNYIRIAHDLNATVAPADTLQNIGIYYSFGTNQVISGNTIEFQGDDVSDGSNFATEVGMQCDTGVGNTYEGLQITNNTLRVLHAQNASHPQVILGIWENGHAHSSNITVSGNTFVNQDAGNNPAVNLQRAFRVTSHSSNSTTVTYSNNTVSGANTGFQWLAGQNFSGNQPVVLTGNTITNNGTGVLVQSQGLANLKFNRIVGNAVGLNNVDGVATAQNNWWGCNAGPGNTGCDSTSGTVNFNPWIVLGVSAAPSAIGPLDTSTVTADMTHDSNSSTTVGVTTLPLPNASFTATNGGMSPASNGFTSGQSQSTFTPSSAAPSSACAKVDNEQQCASLTVALPSFSIDNVTLAEGNAGTTAFTFTITKSGPGAASVDYATVNGTATAPTDYTAIPTTTLNFLSGDASKQVTVQVNGDTTVETNEAFTVHLSNAVNATISNADGLGTINNDDSCATFSTVYVNKSWAGTTVGNDPDLGGPATTFGCDSFATIQDGVNAVAAGGTVNVYAGTYDEDVTISQPLSLLGIDSGAKTIRGAIGGSGSTISVGASNVTIAGLTITRVGNNTTDWNNPGLNTAGISIQGQAITNALIRDNIITGNRTGIDINNSNGHTVRNNSINDNRTGMILRNQTDNLTVVENFITNNWTVGVLFLDGSGGTNSPVQTAHYSDFNNNDLSGNWYGQIVDRQTGGSLPATGTTNLKNFRGNWFGTASPVTTTANSTEPGYAAQIPVAFGGTATPPGGQPDIAGPASANFKIDPVLTVGTDTNVETTPGRGTNGFQGVAINQLTVVEPSNLHGWVDFDDLPGTGTGSAGFVDGPGTAPLGAGSAFLKVDDNGRHALGTTAYMGTRMDDITELKYSSYQNNNTNTAAAISLQFDIDYDLNDGNSSYMGRLVFEPYISNTVQQGVWQNWDAMAGKWWGTRTTVTVNGVAGVAQPCQQATPCTWAQVLSLFPNAGVGNTPARALLFKAGGPVGPGGFDGNVDDFSIKVNTVGQTYDFEPNPHLSINDVSHNEGNAGTTSYDFTVTLSRPSSGTVTVDYATANSTAVAPGDFTAIGATQLTFNPGETTKPVSVLVNGDLINEPDEQFFVNLSNPSVNADITDNQGVGTIVNDDAQPSFSISDVTQNEGNAGITNFTFTVTKTGATAFPSSVQFQTIDGTATVADNDYVSQSGTLNFAPADTTMQVVVQVNGDTKVEPNEAFTVHLSAPSGATISDADGTGTITNDDTGVSLAVSPASVLEDGATNLVYTFTRNGDASGALTVNFSVGGNATFGTDYTQSGAAAFTATTGTVTFAAGSSTATVTIDPTADTTVEPDETVILTVTSGTGYNVATPAAATGTIINDDTDVSVAVSPASVAEDGATNLVYTFTRSGVTTGAMTVNFSVGGNATLGTDYTQGGAATFSATTGTVTFAAGSSTATVTIDPTADTTVEPDETVILTVTSGTGYNVGTPSSATGTITNDDTDVSIAVSPASVLEDGAANLVYTFTRNGVTSGPLTVSFSVAGNAAFSTDYTQSGAASFTATNGTVTFAAGSSTATITIDPTADTTVEPDETVILTVTSGSGYNVATPSAATGTITNDDTGVSVAVSPASVLEDGNTNLVYTFTRSGSNTGPMSVNFTVAGTATFNSDYTQSGAATFTATNGTVTFAAGSSTATVTIDPTADTTQEPDETVILTVASGSGYGVGSPSAATGTILNDDQILAPSTSILQFDSASYNTTESSFIATITVQRLGDTTGAVSVDYATPDDSAATSVVPCATVSGVASPRCDFTAAAGTLRWAAGDSTPKSFVVLISQDNYVEGPEQLPLTLSNPVGNAQLGSPSTAVLTIADDVTEPAQNPIDDSTNFVRQQYHDFLNREPDQSGFNFWVGTISECGLDPQCIEVKRINASGAFYLSIEFQGTGYFVERLYKSSYGDATGTSTFGGPHQIAVPIVKFSELLPDTQEIGRGVVVNQPGWEAALEANKVALTEEFVQRPRFLNAFPLTMTPAQFVDALNTNAGNPLSTTERNQLVSDLTGGVKTRAQVLRAVTDNQNLINAEFNRGFVLKQYFGYLRRNPNAAPDVDYSGYDFWLQKLNSFNGNFQNAEMVKAFLSSAEYRRRSGAN